MESLRQEVADREMKLSSYQEDLQDKAVKLREISSVKYSTENIVEQLKLKRLEIFQYRNKVLEMDFIRQQYELFVTSSGLIPSSYRSFIHKNSMIISLNIWKDYTIFIYDLAKNQTMSVSRYLFLCQWIEYVHLVAACCVVSMQSDLSSNQEEYLLTVFSQSKQFITEISNIFETFNEEIVLESLQEKLFESISKESQTMKIWTEKYLSESSLSIEKGVLEYIYSLFMSYTVCNIMISDLLLTKKSQSLDEMNTDDKMSLEDYGSSIDQSKALTMISNIKRQLISELKMFSLSNDSSSINSLYLNDILVLYLKEKEFYPLAYGFFYQIYESIVNILRFSDVKDGLKSLNVSSLHEYFHHDWQLRDEAYSLRLSLSYEISCQSMDISSSSHIYQSMMMRQHQDYGMKIKDIFYDLEQSVDLVKGLNEQIVSLKDDIKSKNMEIKLSIQRSAELEAMITANNISTPSTVMANPIAELKESNATKNPSKTDQQVKEMQEKLQTIENENKLLRSKASNPSGSSTANTIAGLGNMAAQGSQQMVVELKSTLLNTKSQLSAWRNLALKRLSSPSIPITQTPPKLLKEEKSPEEDPVGEKRANLLELYR